MTTATIDRPPSSIEDRPRWVGLEIAWRAVSALGLTAGTIAVIANVGVDYEGLARVLVSLFSAAVTLLAARALQGTLQQRHVGRIAGFAIDGLVAVVTTFLALNRMGMFVGLDTVGEAFNGAIGWGAIILIGWLVRGVAAKAGASQRRIERFGSMLIAVGFAVLLIAMGIIPGLIEFVQRLVRPEVLPLALLAAVAVASARMLYSTAASDYYGSTQRESEAMDGLLFVAPNALGFLTFFAGPLVASLIFSFTEWDGLTEAKFVWFDNYRALFSDDLFLRSLRNVVVFGVIAIPLAVVPALFLAALLNSKLPGMKAFRAIYFLPSIGGVVGVTLIWKQLFNSTVGYVNYAILRTTEAVNAVLGTSFEAAQPQWISDSSIAMIAVIILFAWQQIGFNTVLFLAGMQGIDTQLYEAAEIDGATGWKKFSRITVPLLRSTTVFVVATSTILGLQLFNEPFILQSPSSPAGPNNSTLTPVIYLYQNAFQQFEIGYASAVAWALFILIFGITLLYFRQGEDGEFGKV
jgi:ABC-type sugar transport system permease subunit